MTDLIVQLAIGSIIFGLVVIVIALSQDMERAARRVWWTGFTIIATGLAALIHAAFTLDL